MIHKEIGELIRQKRQEKGMTQLDLAKALGYESVQFIHLMETGKSKIPLKALGKLSVVLKIDKRSLLNRLIDDHANWVKNQFELGVKS